MNARACVGAGAAFMVADADVEGPEFERHLLSLVGDEGVRERHGRGGPRAEDAGRGRAFGPMRWRKRRAPR